MFAACRESSPASGSVKKSFRSLLAVQVVLEEGGGAVIYVAGHRWMAIDGIIVLDAAVSLNATMGAITVQILAYDRNRAIIIMNVRSMPRKLARLWQREEIVLLTPGSTGGVRKKEKSISM